MCNRFYRRTAFLLVFGLLIAAGTRAQLPNTTVIISQETADSLIALLSPGEYDSLMTELDEMFSIISKSETSYADISLTAGNGNFTLRNADAASATYKTTNRFLFSPAAGYFHKSGLGVQWSSFFTMVNKKPVAYQHQASVFYDYLKGKKISAGISYSRSFINDSTVDFYNSPFKNNYFAYAAWKKNKIRPAVSLSYSNGSYIEAFNRPLFSVYYKVLIKEISLTASVRYSAGKKNWLTKGDYLSFTPRLALISSGQRIETVNHENNNFIQRLMNNGFIAQRSVNSFEPQVLALYISADYILGKWYLHPQFYVDYYLHNADRRSYTSFSLTTGFMF